MNTKSVSEDGSPGVPQHHQLYRTLLIGGAVIVVILVAVALATWNTLLFGFLGLPFDGGPTALILLRAIWLFQPGKYVQMKLLGPILMEGRLCIFHPVCTLSRLV